MERISMQKLSLDAMARELLERARAGSGGRAAETVVGGHERVLRQTVIAMMAGSALGDHENPGEATVHVLTGRVRLTTGDTAWDGRSGDLIIVPDSTHRLAAQEDAVVLLTVAKPQ
jgi:quercetin dioxygenase-like cupin family protein